MGNNKITHIMWLDKFGIPFLQFLKDNFNISSHRFIVFNVFNNDETILDGYNALVVKNKSQVFHILDNLYTANKIILHGLWNERIIQLLFFQPWLLKKCYWVMWGGDFYFPENHSWIKKQVIKSVGHLVTYIEGDYELVVNIYNASGQYHECLMYPSNLYKPYEETPLISDVVHIQIGNSADPTNHHLEVLNQLKKYRHHNIKISIPFSYSLSDAKYASRVKEKAHQLFGDKVYFLTDFMPFDEYMNFLSSVDIAIFAHNRQQGMGNIISLLGIGKKVYLRNNVTHKRLFDAIGIKTYELQSLNLDLISEEVMLLNKKRIESYFAVNKLYSQLSELFES